MTKFALPIVIAALLAPGQLPASSKPCRDKDGRIITCPKVRKPSPRCKNAEGRFIACVLTREEEPKRP